MLKLSKKPRPNPPLAPVPPPPTGSSLSFCTILQRFPNFFLQILPYIADRRVWNAIIASNKNLYLKSKEETFPLPLPPWPMNCNLRVPFYHFPKYRTGMPIFSPDGTEIACILCYDWDRFNKYMDYEEDHSYDDYDNDYETGISKVVIFHQRGGPVSFRQGGNDDNNNNNISNNNIGWVVSNNEGEDYPMELKYSPDGKFLVSVDAYMTIKIWNYNVIDRRYQTLYERDLHEEVIERESGIHTGIFDVSPCRRYVVIVTGQHILLKDAEKNWETIRSMLLPESEWGHQVAFSNVNVGGHHSIFIRSGFNSYGCKHGGKLVRYPRILNVIKIWHPFTIVNKDDDNPTATSITILEHSYSSKINKFVLSNKKSLIAMYDTEQTEGKEVNVYSIDDISGTKRLSLKQSIFLELSSSNRYISVKFTPDDNYLYYNDRGEDRYVFFDLQSGEDVTEQMHASYKKNGHFSSLVDCLPADDSAGEYKFNYYDSAVGCYKITSFWKK